MLKKCIFGVLLAIVGLLQVGCATLADAKAAKGSGESRVYDKPLDIVWDATVEVIKASDLDLVSEDKKSGTILAQRSMTAFSWGENVAVFVQEADGKTSTRVEVVSKRTLATNITAANWGRIILGKLDDKIGPGKQLK